MALLTLVASSLWRVGNRRWLIAFGIWVLDNVDELDLGIVVWLDK